MWNKIDSANEGLLDLDRITLLMKSLNIKLSRNEIKSALKQSNISKSSLVNFDTFERFYSSLRFRPEIAELFSNLCLTNPQYLTFNEFYTFVCETQQMGWDKLRCEEIFQKFLDSDTNGMDIEHFTIFLISSRNNVFRKTCMEVYQDMDRPLCDYFINSSHNTYLLGDQIVSESSVEGYIRALQKGCRCVELDCWDGPNLQPVIYHGRTLTSKIFFKDAIETICKYAFVSCSTPLILSFEMHCSLEQQNIIARMLINTFGDSLLAEPVAGYPLNLLPSPNLLKNKVLIKCKYPDTIYDEQQDSGDDTKVSTTPIEGVILKRPSLLSLRRPPSSESNENCDVVRPKTKTFQISKSLSKLIPYLRGTPSKGLETLTSDLQFNHLFSFTEGKATTFMQKQLDTYKQLTSANLLRVYPSILRVTSSNYDPLPYWINGTQMVALNFQTFDRSMELNKALFEDNGGCGFVLKPSKLSKPRRIRIDVISAQQIQQTIANPSDSIKAVVTIETFGHEVDNLKFKTTTKKSNGFNPLWKEHFEFQIQYPDFCFMRFQLVDVDPPFTNAQCFGSYTIRLSCLMPGYRHIPLNDRMGERLGFSTVFVKISFSE
ncbi:PLC-like phosphodiesterase [Globomyces pollinis-pini]|nr:PLC-like phosphodiesterase [Globomyces pollinis-pini]